MNKYLENYISFLPAPGQEAIDNARTEAQEPVSILTAIHWVAHHEDVDETLGRLIIKELNLILNRLTNSNNSVMVSKSLASLTLTPDRCYAECFGEWEDYDSVVASSRILERFLGRRMFIRPNPRKWPQKPSLISRLHKEAEERTRPQQRPKYKQWKYKKDADR